MNAKKYSIEKPVLVENKPGQKKVYLYRGVRCWFDRIEFDKDPVFNNGVQATEFYVRLDQNKGDDSDWLTYQPPIDRW
jgi:hypothetical protein